jgi:ligand-binding SRPBCC domain-containing protein
MKTYVLERSQVIRRPRREVFAFFADAFNLELITPEFLHFRILTPFPIQMAPGTTIEYELRLFGVPLRWSTLIEKWTPGASFVDVQMRGPYRFWRHLHSFADERDGSVRVSDRVEYQMPFGFLGRLAHALIVRKLLEKIFDYRARTTKQLLDESVQSLGLMMWQRELFDERF